MKGKILVTILILAAFAAGLAVSPELLNPPNEATSGASEKPAEPKTIP